MFLFIAQLLIILLLIGPVFGITWELFYWRISSNVVLVLLLLIFGGLFQVEIDVYILYCKYQVKPH